MFTTCFYEILPRFLACSHYRVILCHPQLKTKMQHPNERLWRTIISLLRTDIANIGGTCWTFRGSSSKLHRRWNGSAPKITIPDWISVIFGQLTATRRFLSNSWQFSRGSRDFPGFLPVRNPFGFSVLRCPMRPWCLAPWLWSSPPRMALPSKAPGGTGWSERFPKMSRFKRVITYKWENIRHI